MPELYTISKRWATTIISLGKEDTLLKLCSKKALLNSKLAVMSGGPLGTKWALGAIEDNITMMKVKTGEMVLVILILRCDDYFTYSRTKCNYSVEGCKW